MNKEYLLILPNVFIGEPFTIGNITFQRFGSEDNRFSDDKSRELLINTQQMLVNNGFSGIFTYYYFTSEDNFQKILLNIRKVIALFRYIAFEKHSELNLGSLTYYLLTPIKMEVSTLEMKYSLDGLQDGSSQAHFWAPGFKEVTRERNYPHILHLDNEHFLIQKFNSGELEDNYIIAIERFNRTFKENYDPVDDILNLTTAFEHIFKLKGKGNKCRLFANRLIQELGLSRDTTLSKFFSNWSEEFYRVRGEISHGNAFQEYSEKRGYEYWEECFMWKHPDGTVRYIPHASIARKVFQLVITERYSKVTRIDKIALETAPQEMRSWLAQIDSQIMESYIEPLITPNEIYYRGLKELIDFREPFGSSYYSIISSIKQYDGTEEKSVLLYLLKYFLSLTREKFPDLKERCDKIEKLIAANDIALVSVKVSELSHRIYQKSSNKEVITDEVVYNNSIARFFEKVFYSLSQIAWLEKFKSGL